MIRYPKRTKGTPMLVGYARTSTLDQEAGLEAQIRDLKAAGCEEVFAEQVSSVAQRAKLKEALTFLRKGDTLVVTRLDRLARSTRDLLELRDRIKGKGAQLNVLNLGDTGTATGELVFTVIGAIAQFERTLMLERQKEGIAKAKAEGKYKGRPSKLHEKLGEIRARESQGLNRAQIAHRLGMARSSLYRLIDAA
jgi:DNA invertase Pin-like site-specific DNA recombinase